MNADMRARELEREYKSMDKKGREYGKKAHGKVWEVDTCALSNALILNKERVGSEREK